MSCDFEGNDIGNETTSGEECKDLCIASLGCTHFSWSNHICYKKSGPVTKLNAKIQEDYICSIVDKKSNHLFCLVTNWRIF